MEHQSEIVRGRLVTARHGDEVATTIEILIEPGADERPGRFRFRIGEAFIGPGLRYRLLADDGRVFGLRVEGVEPADDDERVSIVEGAIDDPADA
ncbi:hypothetical protein [Paludisphaera rhizosphaerae]|uniref:hypothetical protein n=1 Tax=Paludisphaera rhizosphaerae TaxID=2711216 RepID=UPI0013EDBC30|nr:hypothetical protein [Paludisphaera rhizosphaerae]